MKNKWKILAIYQYFSHIPSNSACIKLYDALMNCNTEAEVGAVITEHEAVVWEPFESYTDRHFPSLSRSPT